MSKGEPAPWCATVRGVVWYSVRAPHRGAMVTRLAAQGELDAAVAVYRLVRSQRSQVGCAQTDEHGHAVISWYAYPNGSYLIAVAPRVGSSSGTFRLGVVAAEQVAQPPGDPLPVAGVQATVNPILDAADAWALPMTRGTTYRINLTAPSHLVSLAVYRPNTYSFTLQKPVRTDETGGYLVFTPGYDGGGVYSLVVRTEGDEPVARLYRLQTAPAEEDDIAPGIKLNNGQTVVGAVSGDGIDTVDLYRFNVPRPYALTTVTLQQEPKAGLDLLLLSETGAKIAGRLGRHGRQVMLEHLRVGRYFLAVRAPTKSSGNYRLQVFVRDITTTSISAGGSRFLEVPPGTSVPIAVHVTSANIGGRVVVAIDKLDPLAGWQFSSLIAGRVDPSGVLTLNWTPQSVGHWRLRARFAGTPFSSYSQSDYAYVHVAEPLT